MDSPNYKSILLSALAFLLSRGLSPLVLVATVASPISPVTADYLASVIEENVDLAMTLQPRDGVDGDPLAHTVAPMFRRCRRDFGSENR